MTTLFTDVRAPVPPAGARTNGHRPIIDLPVWTSRDAVEDAVDEPVDVAPAQPTPAPAVQPAARPVVASALTAKLDADLAKSVRRSGYMRQIFYVVVLGVALAGQVTGAVEALGIPLLAAIPAVGALELGGIVVLNNADVRRRLGERATGSRVLSVLIAAWAVAFNWMAHDNKLLAGFFAGMSALGYLVWLMHTENQRRDRLRATGDLPPTTPAYELVGHWVRHPWLTLRAKNLAKADAKLGLYSSIGAAKAEIAAERRHAAIGRVLKQEMRRSTDRAAAVLGEVVYDRDRIARRVAADADYDGLTALVMARLDPRRVVGEQPAQGAQPKAAQGGPAMPAQSPTAAVVGPAHLEPPTPTRELPAQPTPVVGRAEHAHSHTPKAEAPTPTRPTAHVGGAQPTPTTPGAQPKQPTGTRPAQPKTARPAQPIRPAQPPTPIPGLTELQQSRLADLASEFPGEVPGRDKAMAHMRAQGYQGWSSKEPAKTLINMLRAQREAAQGAQPSPTAQPTVPAQPTGEQS